MLWTVLCTRVILRLPAHGRALFVVPGMRLFDTGLQIFGGFVSYYLSRHYLVYAYVCRASSLRGSRDDIEDTRPGL